MIIPILACSGGDTTTTPPPEPVPAPPPPSNDVNDPVTTIQGNWKVFPSDSDLRELKIINLAIDTSSNEADLDKRISPPPTDAEKSEYESIHKSAISNPNDPSIVSAKNEIEMLKSAEMDVDASNVTLRFGGAENTWTYTVKSSSMNNLALTLSSNEDQTYTFEGPDVMRMHMNEQGSVVDLRFTRKKPGEGKAGKGEGKAGKGDGEGKAGKGEGGKAGGGGGEGKAGKGGKAGN